MHRIRPQRRPSGGAAAFSFSVNGMLERIKTPQALSGAAGH